MARSVDVVPPYCFAAGLSRDNALAIVTNDAFRLSEQVETCAYGAGYGRNWNVAQNTRHETVEGAYALRPRRSHPAFRRGAQSPGGGRAGRSGSAPAR